MEKELVNFDLETLHFLYTEETNKLRRALINGASWEEVKDQRKNVTELAIALHKKTNSSVNPSEHPLRSA